MILIITPENTWKPWKPVMKKKKLANNLLPYSFLYMFAPSTTYTTSSKRFKDSSLVRTTFCLSLMNSVRTKMLGLALKPSTTSATEYDGKADSPENQTPLSLVC